MSAIALSAAAVIGLFAGYTVWYDGWLKPRWLMETNRQSDKPRIAAGSIDADRSVLPLIDRNENTVEYRGRFKGRWFAVTSTETADGPKLIVEVDKAEDDRIAYTSVEHLGPAWPHHISSYGFDRRKSWLSDLAANWSDQFILQYRPA